MHILKCEIHHTDCDRICNDEQRKKSMNFHCCLGFLGKSHVDLLYLKKKWETVVNALNCFY